MKLKNLKQIFQSFVDSLDTFFEQGEILTPEEQAFLRQEGYEVTPRQIPTVPTPMGLGCPFIDGHHVTHKDGTELNATKYKEMRAKLTVFRQAEESAKPSTSKDLEVK